MPAGGGFYGPKLHGVRVQKPRCRGLGLCYIPALFPANASIRHKGNSFMAHESEYQHGSMDISAHKKAYAGFLTGSKWTFGFVLLIMVFLALFRTHG